MEAVLLGLLVGGLFLWGWVMTWLYADAKIGRDDARRAAERNDRTLKDALNDWGLDEKELWRLRSLARQMLNLPDDPESED